MGSTSVFLNRATNTSPKKRITQQLTFNQYLPVPPMKAHDSEIKVISKPDLVIKPVVLGETPTNSLILLR